MDSSPSGLTELCSGKSGSRSRSPVPGASARGESAFMTGTLTVTAGRGEAGRTHAGPRRLALAHAGIGGGGPGDGLDSFYSGPVWPVTTPVSDSIGIYPRQKYADRRHKRLRGYTAVIATGRRDLTAVPEHGKSYGVMDSFSMDSGSTDRGTGAARVRAPRARRSTLSCGSCSD